MPQQLLKMKQRTTEIEEMHGKGMTQGMWMYPFFEAAASYGFPDNMLYSSIAQGLPGFFDALDEGVFRHIAQHFAISA